MAKAVPPLVEPKVVAVPVGAGPGLFHAIEREATLADRVSQKLESLILSNTLPTGERLPSERELGDQFGVSRTVIREAVRAVAAKGLLEVRTGDGTFVTEVKASSASAALSRLLRLTGAQSPAGARSLYEVRRPLEIAIAGFAAERATVPQIEELRGLVEVIQKADLPKDEFVAADIRFHLLLAESTQNHLFSALLNSVSDLMTAVRELGTSVPGARKDACHHHKSILSRIVARDVSGACRAMEAHMDASEIIFDKAVVSAG